MNMNINTDTDIKNLLSNETVILKNRHYNELWKIKDDIKIDKSKNIIKYCNKITSNCNDNKLYILKILKCDDNHYNINFDYTTIQLHYKLSLINITPKIYDCGYYYEDEDKTKCICYYVMEKYDLCGMEYLNYILTNNYNDNVDNYYRLYKEYMRKIFTLYKKLAKLGVCTYDIKDDNVIMNYNTKTHEIEDIRLIDMDCEFTEITLNPTVEKSNIYFTAMIFVHFITHNILYKKLKNSPALKYYHGLISHDFDFYDLVKLKYSILQNNKYVIQDNISYQPYVFIVCYYHKKINADTFMKYSLNTRLDIFNKTITTILQYFPTT